MTLRVGVPSWLLDLPEPSSVGRIWPRGVSGLRERGVDVVLGDPRRRLRRARVDVWLTDGHQGPLDVDRPVVAHLLEAAWDQADLRATLDPAFAAVHGAASAAAAAAATRLLTISASSRDQIVEAYGIDADRVEVAHLGVDHAVYRPDLVTGAAVRRPYVLFVSTVHPRKNLAALRGAMSRLARRGFPHALVLVAGPAADRRDSTDLLAEALVPIPYVDAPVLNLAGVDDHEVAALMGSASALCLPSLMEGFGMSVAEAMACATPCVVSDRGSLPEVVGDAGIVVEPTAEAVEEGLAPLLEDPAAAAELGARAAERARRFTWEAMADGWLRCLTAAA